MVTDSNAARNILAIPVKETRTNSENLGDILLLDAALREEDARGGLGLGLDTLDQDAVEEGGEVLDVTEDRLFKKESLSMYYFNHRGLSRR